MHTAPSGLATATFAGQAYAWTCAMAIDPASGRVVLGGSAGSTEYGLPVDGSGDASAVAIFAADGTLDPTWGWASPHGTGEMLQVEGGYGPEDGVVTALAFDADGRLLAAGVSDNTYGVSGPTFVLRYTPDGSLDGSFDPDVIWHDELAGQNGQDRLGGEFRWGSASQTFTPATMAVDASGDIDLVGQDGYLAVMRLLPDGQGVDTSYGNGGIADVGPVTGTNVQALVAVTAAGDLLAVGVAGDGSDGVLLAFSPAPHARPVVAADRLYAEVDANDDVTSLSDSTGAVVERYIYDSYGNVTVLNPDGTVRGDGTAASSAYGMLNLFQGMRLDPDTGLYYDQERQTYDPSLGRFLQQDPAGYVNGPNIYQVEESNPTNRLDPSGEATFQPFFPLPGVGPGQYGPAGPGDPAPGPYVYPVGNAATAAPSAVPAGGSSIDTILGIVAVPVEFGVNVVAGFTEVQAPANLPGPRGLVQLTGRVFGRAGGILAGFAEIGGGGGAALVAIAAEPETGVSVAAVPKSLGVASWGVAAVVRGLTLPLHYQSAGDGPGGNCPGDGPAQDAPAAENQPVPASQLRQWAIDQGYVQDTSNPNGPETWVDPATGEWRLKIKEPSSQTGIDRGSQVPRASARTSSGQYINPITGQTGTRGEVGHIPIDPSK